MQLTSTKLLTVRRFAPHKSVLHDYVKLSGWPLTAKGELVPLMSLTVGELRAIATKYARYLASEAATITTRAAELEREKKFRTGQKPSND